MSMKQKMSGVKRAFTSSSTLLRKRAIRSMRYTLFAGKGERAVFLGMVS